MTKYRYDPDIQRQVEHHLKLALGTVVPHITVSTLAEDLGGIDVLYAVNGLPVQTRVREDRPYNAATVDVTFRTTEPAMIDAKTYAPLAAFFWAWNKIIKAGRLVDPYRAHWALDIRSYDPIPNGDGTAFHPVPFGDLLEADAWLRSGDEHDWTTISTGGMARVERMLRDGWHPKDTT